MKEYYKTELGTLYRGDCLDIMEDIADKSIDVVITDIPYNIDYSSWDILHNNTNSALGKQNENMKNKKFKSRGKPINGWSKNDLNRGNEYEEWLYKIFLKLFSKCKEGSPVLIFSSRRFQHNVANSLEKSGFIIKDILIWEKDGCHAKAQRINKVLSKRGLDKEEYNEFRLGNLKPMYEPIIYAFKPYSKTVTQCFLDNEVGCIRCEKDIIPSNIFRFKREFGLHETQKPLELIKKLITIFSVEDHLILDFTSGSGTLAVACENTNRRWICIEKDTDDKGNILGYCDITVDRLKGGVLTHE